MLTDLFFPERVHRAWKDLRLEPPKFPKIPRFDNFLARNLEPPDARLEKILFDYIHGIGVEHPQIFEVVHAYPVQHRFQTTPTLRGMEMLMDQVSGWPIFQVAAIDMPSIGASLRRLGSGLRSGFLQFLIHYETGHCNLAFLRFQGNVLEVCHLESGPLIESCRCTSDNCEALSNWGGITRHFVFKAARLKSNYGCRALMILDHAAFGQALMWNQIDWMKIHRPWWFEDISHTKDQGESLYQNAISIRYMPPHLMLFMESVRELENYMKDREVRAFWGNALMDEMEMTLEPFLKAQSYDLGQKPVNTLLKTQHLLQIESLVRGLFPEASLPPWSI